MKLRQVLVCMGDVYKRSGSYGSYGCMCTNDPDRMGDVWVHVYALNWLQQTFFSSVRKGAETKFSIQLVHRGRGTLRVPCVSQF